MPLVFLLLFFTPFTSISGTLCIRESIPISKVRTYISDFQVQGMDQLNFDAETNCVSIHSRADRVELLSKLIRNKFPVDTVKKSMKKSVVTINSTPKECRLVLIEERVKDVKGEDRKVGKDLVISNSKDQIKSTSRNMITTLENKRSVLRVGENDYSFLCKLTYTGAEISFFKFGEETSISTTINLSQGVKREIGATLRDIEESSESKGIPIGYEKRERKGFDNSKFYLQLN